MCFQMIAHLLLFVSIWSRLAWWFDQPRKVRTCIVLGPPCKRLLRKISRIQFHCRKIIFHRFPKIWLFLGHSCRNWDCSYTKPWCLGRWNGMWRKFDTSRKSLTWVWLSWTLKSLRAVKYRNGKSSCGTSKSWPSRRRNRLKPKVTRSPRSRMVNLFSSLVLKATNILLR